MSRGKLLVEEAKQFLQIKNGMILKDSDLAITKKFINDFIRREVKSDLDLPEGFIISTLNGVESIKTKRGLLHVLKTIKLGIDENGLLTAADRKIPIKRTKLKILNWIPPEQILNPEGMVDTMFKSNGITPNPDYKTHGKSANWWRNHIRKRRKLKTRPKLIHAD